MHYIKEKQHRRDVEIDKLKTSAYELTFYFLLWLLTQTADDLPTDSQFQVATNKLLFSWQRCGCLAWEQLRTDYRMHLKVRKLISFRTQAIWGF